METNIQIIKDVYSKFASGDVPGLLNLLSTDVRWQTPLFENASFGGIRTGRGEVSDFF